MPHMPLSLEEMIPLAFTDLLQQLHGEPSTLDAGPPDVRAFPAPQTNDQATLFVRSTDALQPDLPQSSDENVVSFHQETTPESHPLSDNEPSTDVPVPCLSVVEPATALAVKKYAEKRPVVNKRKQVSRLPFSRANTTESMASAVDAHHPSAAMASSWNTETTQSTPYAGYGFTNPDARISIGHVHFLVRRSQTAQGVLYYLDLKLDSPQGDISASPGYLFVGSKVALQQYLEAPGESLDTILSLMNDTASILRHTAAPATIVPS